MSYGETIFLSIFLQQIQKRMLFWEGIPVNKPLSQEEEVSQDGLDKEGGGDAKRESPFLRFVPEEIHTQECADAASCDRHPDEGRFRYAPLSAAGLPFVDSEDKEGQDIDADEIYDDCSQVRRVVTPINPNLLIFLGNLRAKNIEARHQ